MARVFGAPVCVSGARTAVLVVLCGAAFLIGGSASASAGTGSIPRPPGGVDNRGYELVSQAEKNGNQLRYASQPTVNGDRMIYEMYGGLPGSPNGEAVLQANRTTTGWVSKTMMPALGQVLESNYTTSASTPDLSRTIATVFSSLGQSNTDPDERLVMLDGSHPGPVQQTLLHIFPILFGNPAGAVVTSDDLAHVYVPVPRGVDPSLPGYVPGDGSRSNVFDVGIGGPVLVSRMPATDQAPVCGVPLSPIAFASTRTAAESHWVSTDGSRIFFQTGGDGPSCTKVELYMRDRAAHNGSGATTVISGPPVGADPDLGIDQFLLATQDGSEAFYRTATSLDPRDDVDGVSNDVDIYRWSATGGNFCVTCAVPNANVSTGTGTNAEVSEDGSHVYFGATAQLADAPGPAVLGNAAPNLYVWNRSNDSVHFIAEVRTIGGATRFFASQVTPDGNILIFRGFGPAAASNNCVATLPGTCFEYYRYDDRDRSVTCLSCPSGGGTLDVGPSLLRDPRPFPSRDRAVSDDGNIVAFPATDPLVPDDVNRSQDLYEWHQGTVKLITDGVTRVDPIIVPQLISLTPSGKDIFFQDNATLTPEASDGSSKLYDARVNGGFVSSVPPPECDGDQCQAPPSLPLALDTLVDGSGAGNVASNTPGRFSVQPVSAAARALFARTGRLKLSVAVSKPGRVSALAQIVFGKRHVIVGRSSKMANKAGKVSLAVHLSSRARLPRASSGRLKVLLDLSFSRAAGRKRLVLVLRSSAAGR